MCSYRDEKKMRLYIGFRGSHFVGNWLHDATRFAGKNQMDKVAKKYDGDVTAMIRENPRYFPFLIVGHSAGLDILEALFCFQTQPAFLVRCIFRRQSTEIEKHLASDIQRF